METASNLQIGERLRKLRLRRGLSMADLSRETGIAQSTICAYEKGKSALSAKNLCVLSAFYMVSKNSIMTAVESESSTDTTLGSLISSPSFVQLCTVLGQIDARRRESVLSVILQLLEL